MPTVATRHEHHAGRVVGSGHCVAYVREVTGLPPTAAWRRGVPVQDAPHPVPGTAIATFDPDGTYGNHMDGRSHCAILHAAHDDGSITVWDAWLNQPVHQRVIRDRGGSGDAANDASRFYVIELA